MTLAITAPAPAWTAHRIRQTPSPAAPVRAPPSPPLLGRPARRPAGPHDPARLGAAGRTHRSARGMVSAEWAVGIIAAIAIAGVLLAVVTSGPVQDALLRFILSVIQPLLQRIQELGALLDGRSRRARDGDGRVGRRQPRRLCRPGLDLLGPRTAHHPGEVRRHGVGGGPPGGARRQRGCRARQVGGSARRYVRVQDRSGSITVTVGVTVRPPVGGWPAVPLKRALRCSASPERTGDRGYAGGTGPTGEAWPVHRSGRPEGGRQRFCADRGGDGSRGVAG